MGTVTGTQAKINIVQRLLVGLHTAGVERIHLMPDSFGIGRAALDRLPGSLAEARQRTQLLDMPVEHSPAASRLAAEQLRDMGAGCIVVLGGDGTNRVVAQGCGPSPLLSISTGTNNVIPSLVEGTVAGLAAGFAARHPELLSRFAYRSKRLAVEGDVQDMALVDIAVVEGSVVGSRAIWEPQSLRQVILTRAEPYSTGLSSIGGFLQPVSPTEPDGLSLKFGEPARGRVTAPLAPGLMTTLPVAEIRRLSPDEPVTVAGGNRLLALDGEREILLRRGQTARIYLRQDGPWLVDIYKTLALMSERGVLVEGF